MSILHELAKIETKVELHDTKSEKNKTKLCTVVSEVSSILIKHVFNINVCFLLYCKKSISLGKVL